MTEDSAWETLDKREQDSILRSWRGEERAAQYKASPVHHDEKYQRSIVKGLPVPPPGKWSRHGKRPVLDNKWVRGLRRDKDFGALIDLNIGDAVFFHRCRDIAYVGGRDHVGEERWKRCLGYLAYLSKKLDRKYVTRMVEDTYAFELKLTKTKPEGFMGKCVWRVDPGFPDVLIEPEEEK